MGYLKEAGMEVQLFENVEPDPSVETVMRGAEAMREFQPDWIISMGGGSPIDAAKAMWVFYEYPDTTFEEIIQPFSFPELRQKAKFLAIPSTSGTATEVTAFSVITDYAKGIKYPLADFNITPDVAAVSYTHLDVYKRQALSSTKTMWMGWRSARIWWARPRGRSSKRAFLWPLCRRIGWAWAWWAASTWWKT